MKLRLFTLALAGALAVLATPALAGAASSGTFKVSASGKQSLSWSISGTRGSCEIRQGTGSGSVGFSFKSSKSSPLYVSRSSGLIGSIPTSASGTQSGSFTETTVTACEGFEPAAPFTADASGCGSFKTGIRMDFATRKGLTWVVGPASPLPLGACPVYGDELFSNDLTQCGDSVDQYRRSWGVASGGIGLFASKMNVSAKTLLKVKKGKKKTVTGKASVDCAPQSTYSNPLSVKGTLTYSLTFKRTG